MVVPDARLTLVLIAPGLFFQAMPIGSAYAAVQLIFPNQVRGLVSAFFMFISSIWVASASVLSCPACLTTIFSKNERMLGPSVSLSIVLASLSMMVILPLTYRHYRRDYELMDSAVAQDLRV